MVSSPVGGDPPMGHATFEVGGAWQWSPRRGPEQSASSSRTPALLQVAQRDDQLWIVDTRANPNEFPELTEGAFTRLVCGPRRFLPRAHVLEVHVTHSPPAYHAEYERIFQCPVTFASHWNALRMEPSVATWRVSQQPRYVFGVLTERGDALLQSLDDSRTTRGRVERLLLPILPTGGAKAETIASALGFSRQTLFRRLKAEGVTYAQVLDDLRHRMAAPLPEWQKDLRQRDGRSCQLLGSSIVFPRLQALDRDQPTGGAQDSGISKRGLAPQVGRAA
jgi:AraC-like DNA-binding protein